MGLKCQKIACKLIIKYRVYNLLVLKCSFIYFRCSVRKTNEGLLPTDGQSTSLLESREKVLKKIRNTNLKIEVEDNAHCNMANKKFSKEQGNIQTYSYASEVNDSDNAPLGHIRRSLLVGPLAR